MNWGLRVFFSVQACADAGRAALVPRVCASLPSLPGRRAWSWSKAGQIEGKGPRWPWDWKGLKKFLHAKSAAAEKNVPPMGAFRAARASLSLFA